MSIFFVFGMTRSKATAMAEKLTPKKRNNEPETEYMARCAEFIRTQTDHFYRSGKTVKLTEGFATPEFAADWMRLAAAKDGGINMYIRAKVVEYDSDGRPLTTDKGTQKTMWKELGEVR